MSANHPIDSDEIDLLELFGIVWRGRWIIASTSLLVALATFIFLSLAPPNYLLTLRVKPLESQAIGEYAKLNNIPDLSTPIYQGGEIIGFEEVISSEKLMNAVIENFRLATDLQQAIEESDSDFEEFEGSAEDKRLALANAADQFSIKTVANEFSDKEAIAYEISTETKQADLTQKVFRRYVKLASQNIRLRELAKIAGIKKSASAKLVYEKKNLEAEINNSKQTYFASVKGRIAILREHAQIARALNLADPSQNLTINTLALTDENMDRESETENLYRNGYRALEAEINLLQDRDKSMWKVFMSSYAQLDAKLRELNSNNYIKLLNDALAASPLTDVDQFKPADFDLDNLLIEPKTNKPLIMILATLLAAMLAGLFVLMRHFIRARSISEI